MEILACIGVAALVVLGGMMLIASLQLIYFTLGVAGRIDPVCVVLAAFGLGLLCAAYALFPWRISVVLS